MKKKRAQDKVSKKKVVDAIPSKVKKYPKRKPSDTQLSEGTSSTPRPPIKKLRSSLRLTPQKEKEAGPSTVIPQQQQALSPSPPTSPDISTGQYEFRERAPEEGLEKARDDEERPEDSGEDGAEASTPDNEEPTTKQLHDVNAPDNIEAPEEERTGEGGIEEEAAEEEVEVVDEFNEQVKVYVPSVELKTYLDDHTPFATKKVTVRSSLSGKFEDFRAAIVNFGLERRFRTTCFGHFLDLNKGVFHPKLAHNLLLRRVYTNKKKEIWFNFHGLPLRFGLEEFALMTGLNCGPTPTEEYLNEIKTTRRGVQLWNFLTGNGRRVASADSILKVIVDPEFKDKSGKFKLCLIWFVHAVLCSKDSRTGVEKDVVCLSCCLEDFNRFPWGRRSYELTLAYLAKPFEERNHPENSYHLYGFPWAFTSWAYEAIPALRLREFPAQKTIPRMLRWVISRTEADTEAVFRHCDAPEVRPHLVPTPMEVRDVLNGFFAYDDEEDVVIDGLKRQLDGVTLLTKVQAPTSPPERVVHGRGSVLRAFSAARGSDMIVEERGYSGFAGDLFGYSRRTTCGDGGNLRGVPVAVQESRNEGHSCKCESFKAQMEYVMKKLDGIEKLIIEQKEDREDRGKRVPVPSAVLQSPFTAEKKRGKKKRRQKVFMYRELTTVEEKKKAELYAFIEERDEEKTHKGSMQQMWAYKEFEELLNMTCSFGDQIVDELLCLMRVRHKAYSQHYPPTDVILDLSFFNQLCELYRETVQMAEGLGAPLEAMLNEVKFERILKDYAAGKQPIPGGHTWDGAKRVLSVMKLDEGHYCTVVVLVDEGKFLVYDSNPSSQAAEEAALRLKAISTMLPVYMKQCEALKKIPEVVLNLSAWPHECVQDLPVKRTNASSGCYAIAFLDHLLSETPFDRLCDNSLEELRIKWAVDVFRAKMVP